MKYIILASLTLIISIYLAFFYFSYSNKQELDIENSLEYMGTITVVEKWIAIQGCRYTMEIEGFTRLYREHNTFRFVTHNDCDKWNVNQKFKIIK